MYLKSNYKVIIPVLWIKIANHLFSASMNVSLFHQGAGYANYWTGGH